MTAISRYPVPKLEDLPDDIRARILEVQEKSGFVPNVFLAFAHRPAEWRAFFAYHDALMEKDSGLTKAEREMIVVATSNANGCQYCVVAHGAIGRCLIAEITSLPRRDCVELVMRQGYYCKLEAGKAEWFDAKADAA